MVMRIWTLLNHYLFNSKGSNSLNQILFNYCFVYLISYIWELGSNYLLISRDFKNCMVIRAIYFKVFALANRKLLSSGDNFYFWVCRNYSFLI